MEDRQSYFLRGMALNRVPGQTAARYGNEVCYALVMFLTTSTGTSPRLTAIRIRGKPVPQIISPGKRMERQRTTQEPLEMQGKVPAGRQLIQTAIHLGPAKSSLRTEQILRCKQVTTD
jgi:hypothetical protein